LNRIEMKLSRLHALRQNDPGRFAKK